MSRYKLYRGFKDLLPADYKKYTFLNDILEEIGNIYGYKKVDTAIIEESNLFERNYDSNIYHKMYNINRKHVKSLSLNFNNSISILRTVVENKLYVDKSLPLKLMYFKQVFEYYKDNSSGRASKYQYGFECIGDKSVYLDVEIVLLIARVFKFLGINNYKFKIKNLNEKIEYYNSYKQTLTNLGITYSEASNIETMENYYTGIIFEVNVGKFQNLVIGGRYDNLASNIGGPSNDCCGAKIDADKLVEIMDKNHLFPDFRDEIDFYIVPVGERTFKYSLYVSELLREMGAIVEIHYKEYDLKRINDLLDRVNYTYALIIEEEDVKKETLKVINALNKEEKIVYLKDFINDLNSLDMFHVNEEE